MTENKDGNPFVGIAAIIGCLSVAVVAIIAIFSEGNLMVAVWVVGFLTIMGAVLGSLALKRDHK